MTESSPSAPLRFLQAAAYIVIVAWGIRTASNILSVILLALLLACAFLPLPRWLMRRFQLRKGQAIAWSVALAIAIQLVLHVAMAEAGFQILKKLPIYEEHFSSLYVRIAGFLSAHGIQSASLSFKNLYSSERTIEFLRMILPPATGLLSDRILVSLLSLIFLIEMAHPDKTEIGPLARNLVHYGEDAQRFIAISAKTGALTAVTNLVLLIALGVDFPVLWCFLYFFLQFIPSVGFLVAIVPPFMVALLMLGWKRALLLAGGMFLTQMISDYVIQPRLLKKGLHVSFLQIMLSLLIWGFLLGPAGAILAIPLTMALKKFIENPLTEGKHSSAPAPG
jgi:AI-2 transport protein TqsA